MTDYYVDPAASGNNDGSTWEHAWTDLQTAFDTVTAGNTVYCRGTQTLTSAIDIDTNEGSESTGFIKFIGCNASGNNDGTRFVLDGNSTATNCLYVNAKDYWWLENFELKNATGDGFGQYNSNFNGFVMINCISHDNGGHGYSLYYSYVPAGFMILCSAYNNTGVGFYKPYYPIFFFFCNSYDNGSYGFEITGQSSYHSMLTGCVSHNNTHGAYGIAGIVAFNSVFDENDYSGISINGILTAILGCRLTANGEYGLDANTARDCTIYGWNFFLGNTSGTVNNVTYIIPDDGADTNITSGTEGYTGADDFTLTDSATGRRVLVNLR